VALLEKQHKFFSLYVLVGVWVVLIAQATSPPCLPIRSSPYSQFLTLPKRGRYLRSPSQPTRSKQDERSTWRRGETKAFRTQGLIRTNCLHSWNLLRSASRGDRIHLSAGSFIPGSSRFFSLSGIWYFFDERMGSQQAGFMTLGKNKAKKLTWKTIERGPRRDVAGEMRPSMELVEGHRIPENTGPSSPNWRQIPTGILLVGPPETRAKNLPCQGCGRSRAASPSSVSAALNLWRCSWAWSGPCSRPFRAGTSRRRLHHLHRRTGRPGQGPRIRLCGGQTSGSRP